MNDDRDGRVARFEVPPIVKRVRVSSGAQAAFERFAAELAEWWPLASHSVFGEEAASCAIEGRQGGRIVETSRMGETSVWGSVEQWRPPERLVLSWHAGRPEAEAQRVELTFTPVGEGLTEVVLVHSGWENLGPAAQAVRDSYDGGWSVVLARAFGSAPGGQG